MTSSHHVQQQQRIAVATGIPIAAALLLEHPQLIAASTPAQWLKHLVDLDFEELALKGFLNPQIDEGVARRLSPTIQNLNGPHAPAMKREREESKLFDGASAVVVQVLEATDVSQSMVNNVRGATGEMGSGGSAASKRILKLLLSDGFTRFCAFERHPVDALSALLPGGKLRLQGIEFSRGGQLLALEPYCVTLLGGSVQRLVDFVAARYSVLSRQFKGLPGVKVSNPPLLSNHRPTTLIHEQQQWIAPIGVVAQASPPAHIPSPAAADGHSSPLAPASTNRPTKTLFRPKSRTTEPTGVGHQTPGTDLPPREGPHRASSSLIPFAANDGRGFNTDQASSAPATLHVANPFSDVNPAKGSGLPIRGHEPAIEPHAAFYALPPPQRPASPITFSAPAVPSRPLIPALFPPPVRIKEEHDRFNVVSATTTARLPPKVALRDVPHIREPCYVAGRVVGVAGSLSTDDADRGFSLPVELDEPLNVVCDVDEDDGLQSPIVVELGDRVLSQVIGVSLRDFHLLGEGQQKERLRPLENFLRNLQQSQFFLSPNIRSSGLPTVVQIRPFGSA